MDIGEIEINIDASRLPNFKDVTERLHELNESAIGFSEALRGIAIGFSGLHLPSIGFDYNPYPDSLQDEIERSLLIFDTTNANEVSCKLIAIPLVDKWEQGEIGKQYLRHAMSKIWRRRLSRQEFNEILESYHLR